MKRCYSAITAILMAYLALNIANAQQNLFNVPSADITEEGAFFFQQQFNLFTATGLTSNSTLDYGLGEQFEVGVNLFNVDMQTVDGYLQNPHLLLNFQKGFQLSENYKLSFGTQTGFTPPIYHRLIEVPSFSYFHNALDLDEYGKYFLGAYYTNSAYASRNQVGFMVGFDYPLIKNEIHLVGDLIGGNSDISVAVLGFVMFLPKGWQLSLGAQLPAPTSHNDYGMVFEITKL